MALNISAHYSRGELLARLNASLIADGADPNHPTIESLAPYDQFHGRGLEATMEMARAMPARASDRVLDVGCGIGGPARYFASHFGCHVTGIDLTPEFCAVATHLTRLMHLDSQVRVDAGDALNMPYDDEAFDGAYSINVSMNIADKAAFYRGIHRVLVPGGWLLLSEIARGAGADPDFPTPWASGPDSSFLSTPEQTRVTLAGAGFDVVRLESTREAALAYGERARALVDRGEKPPHRAVTLIHGALAREAMANTARALADGRIEPIEILARKRE